MSTSSSITSTLPLFWGVSDGGAIGSSGIHWSPRRRNHGEGKLDPEPGAAVAPVGHLDGTAVFLNNTVSHRKPEAGTLARRLGGEEGIVDAMDVLRGDALPSVGHFDPGARGPRPGAHL